MNINPELVAKIVGILTIIGLILPHLQALIQKPWWSPRVKAILTVVLAAVGGIVAYVTQNGLDLESPEKIVLWIAGVWLASAALYARLLRPVGSTDVIESRVNAGPEPAHADGPE